MKKMYAKAKRTWEKSWLFKAIEKRINNRFRKRLINDSFSILCSDCIGGSLYHRLGKRFLSPTINMFIRNNEFIPFLLDIDTYLAEPLRFIECDEATPVAKIGGV